ncbi:Uncharacterised protein [Legionella donaldsonii]|uniref:DUF2971 domain-containing protein n=1 Tax=Legionella donaldsonii TaxID=45060 RepID=A0A378J880_9GAMM|nr:hypothetical protein [Legionella donaldsonii]STX43952.1 Uncharacterised protein [Legionella donaldsonii]
MPVTPFQLAKQPLDKDAYIWRYMSLSKFMSLLVTQNIYLSRVDLFSDPFEGASTQKNILLRKDLYKDKIPENMLEQISLNFKIMPTWVYANCWHKSDYESDYMWQKYGSVDGAIAIRSTYKNLIESIKGDCVIGMISYVTENDFIPENNILSRFFYKKKAFEHENEIRVLHWHPEFNGNLSVVNNDLGITFPVNLMKLIDSIYISPLSGNWFKNIVTDILEKYSMNITVNDSQLSSNPVY